MKGERGCSEKRWISCRKGGWGKNARERRNVIDDGCEGKREQSQWDGNSKQKGLEE